MKHSKALTASRVRELLDYDPATGVFRWKIARRGFAAAGDVAGGPNTRGLYWAIRVDGRRYRAHRLAWLYVYGSWPPGHLDHKDMVKWNNKVDNLRPATRSQNGGNRSRYANNRSGYKCVREHHGKWAARIQINGAGVHLGVFETPEMAHAAYVAKAKEVFGEFANDGR